MCVACSIIEALKKLRQNTDYIEISPVVLADSTVTVFGMVAQTPPAQVVLGPLGYRLSTAFYN